MRGGGGGGRQTKISLAQRSSIAAGMAAGLTRSFSLRHVLCSEAAYYRDPQALMALLMNCVPEELGTSVVIESTANGRSLALSAEADKSHEPSHHSNSPAIPSCTGIRSTTDANVQDVSSRKPGVGVALSRPGRAQVVQA